MDRANSIVSEGAAADVASGIPVPHGRLPLLHGLFSLQTLACTGWTGSFHGVKHFEQYSGLRY